MNTFEDLVAGAISTTPFPPSLDHSPVIPIDLEINSGGCRRNDHSDEELEPNAFGPADVASILLTSREQIPSPPSSIDDDPDPVARASVQIGVNIVDCAQTGDWSWNER